MDLTAPDRDARLMDAFDGVDTVVHTAWGFQPTRGTAYLQALDVGGTEAVLRAARATGVTHLVHVSSIGVYSRARDSIPVREDWSTGGTPALPYSRHKSAAERLLDAHRLPPPTRLIPPSSSRISVPPGRLVRSVRGQAPGIRTERTRP